MAGIKRSQVFPRAAVLVSPGGVTTGERRRLPDLAGF